MSKEFKHIDCHDVDGNILNKWDTVVVIDVEDLDDDTEIIRGQILMVSECKDPESNSVVFFGETRNTYEFFGHRVLKLHYVKLHGSDKYVLYNRKEDTLYRSNDENHIVLFDDNESAEKHRTSDYEIRRVIDLNVRHQHRIDYQILDEMEDM